MMMMNLGKGFCDLNLPWTGNSEEEVNEIRKCVNRALELGYQTLGLNVTIHQKQMSYKSSSASGGGPTKKMKMETKEEKEKEKEDLLYQIPQSPDLKLLGLEEDPNEKGGWIFNGNVKCTILTRLTIGFINNNFLPFYNNCENSKGYDLLALIPDSANGLLNLLKSGFKADIITFKPEKVTDVKWTRKLYNECVDKNMYFEIPYSEAIRDSTNRRRIISQSHNYHAIGKSKNIILSSQAQNSIFLRTPYDVANLGFIFGLDENSGKAAVKSNCLKAIKSAAGRRIGPYRAIVQKIDENIPSSELWKIPKGKVQNSESSDDDDDDDNGDEQMRIND